MLHVFLLCFGSLQGSQVALDAGPPRLDPQYLQQKIAIEDSSESVLRPMAEISTLTLPEISLPSMQVQATKHHEPAEHRQQVPTRLSSGEV